MVESMMLLWLLGVIVASYGIGYFLGDLAYGVKRFFTTLRRTVR